MLPWSRFLNVSSVTLGKSSLVIQFCENHFVDSYYPTIENTFTKTIKYRGLGLKEKSLGFLQDT